MVQYFFKKPEEAKRGRLITSNCENLVQSIFEQTEERTKGSIHTNIFQVLKQAPVKVLLSRGANKLIL